ncbi:hypothetical protein DL98DRAFT_442143, partial [Cadophora sp. DSE1049]
INIYLGLLDFIVYDYKTNFNFKKFRNILRFTSNTLKLVFVKAYYFISKIKRYYRPFCRTYKIVTEEYFKLNNKNRLQMVIKAVNNIVSLSKLILILLVFGVYPKIIKLDLPNLSVKRRAIIIRKAIKKIRQIYIIYKINDTLGTRNGPKTTYIYNLRFNNEVIVYYKKEGWKGLYEFLRINKKSYKIDIRDGRVRTFRSTSVRP